MFFEAISDARSDRRITTKALAEELGQTAEMAGYSATLLTPLRRKGADLLGGGGGRAAGRRDSEEGSQNSLQDLAPFGDVAGVSPRRGRLSRFGST